MLVLHYTGMADADSAIAWLCNPLSSVSCHYVVDEAGAILQLVDEDRRAWHAGASSWGGVTDLNSASVGIEIVNGGHDFGLPPFPEPQIASVIALCRDILTRHGIIPERVLAHSDIAPARKRDPGERFPWQRLAESGVGAWVPLASGTLGETLERGCSGAPVAALQQRLAAYGYGLPMTGCYDAATEIVVRAFQRHFRPSLTDGRADPDTRATLAQLSAYVRPGAGEMVIANQAGLAIL